MADIPKSEPTVRSITSLADLTLDPQNANRGTPRGRALLKQSLREHGAARSAVVDRNGVVLAGNKTVEAARALGLPVRVVQTNGQALVIVQRTDQALGEGDAARRYALTDNRASEVGLEWDPEVLAQHLADQIPLVPLWTPTELERLLGHGLKSGRTDEDTIVSLRSTTISRGDTFALGVHRLRCGDATDGADVQALLGCDQPRLMATDPPYGVEYDPAWRVRIGGTGRHAVGAVLNDDRADWTEAIGLFPGTIVYLWHAGLHAPTTAATLTRCGFRLRAQIIWVKQGFALSRGDYHWGHEPCWYAVREGASSGWQGDRTQTTVWSVPSLNPVTGTRDAENVVTGHGTQKPVRLFELPILHHTVPGDAVYDPFLGSGTALIAAEKTGRRCLALELEPRYVQAAIDRWEAYAGQTAQKLEPEAGR